MLRQAISVYLTYRMSTDAMTICRTLKAKNPPAAAPAFTAPFPAARSFARHGARQRCWGWRVPAATTGAGSHNPGCFIVLTASRLAPAIPSTACWRPCLPSAPVFDAQAAAGGASDDAPAKTIVIQEQTGSIVGQLAKIPLQNDQITEISASPRLTRIVGGIY